MVQFCANVSMLFAEVPFLQRFGLARAAGFDAVEIQYPYGFAADDIRAALDCEELELVLFNTPIGDVERGDRGLATDPGRVDEFKASIEVCLQHARLLKPSKLNCPPGKRLPTVPDDIQRATVIENLRYASAAAQSEGMVLTVEPLNPFDAPDHYISTPSGGFSLIRDVGEVNLLLEYDIYHAQRTEGDITNTIRKEIELIGHIQIADAPGRHEPGTGELNWAYIFDAIDRAGYTSYIGVEYNPSTALTVDSLAWMEAYRS